VSADKRGQNRDGRDHNGGVNQTSTEQANVRIENSIDVHLMDFEINPPSIRLNEEEKNVGIQILAKDEADQVVENL